MFGHKCLWKLHHMPMQLIGHPHCSIQFESEVLCTPISCVLTRAVVQISPPITVGYVVNVMSVLIFI